MKSESRRWLTAITLLCLAYPAAFAPTEAVERRCTPSSTQGPWAAQPSTHDAESTEGVTASMAQLPLSFEPNVGQTDAQVAFLVRGAGYGAFLTADELVLSLPRANQDAVAGKKEFDPEAALSHRPEPAAETLPPAVVRMRLTGANLSTPVGELPLEAKTNYFIGNDPAAWHTDVPNFGRVRYTDVYPGVDLVYYGNGGGLEYDFVVAPGANPDVVAMEWDGAESVEVDDAGTLIMKVEGGELRQASPVVYQDGDEGRSPVSGAFDLIGAGRVGVRLGAYDPAKPLVIDPVLVYSSFLGGSNGDYLRELEVDAAGAVYVTGTSFSANFPTALPYDSTNNGGSDVIVAKLRPAGNGFIYSTYLGGILNDWGRGLAVDASGAVYVSGDTESTDFPMVNAYDATLNGGTDDAFVAKLTPMGNGLAYSTYLGGSGSDHSDALVVDSDGSAYLTGSTDSRNFPVVNAYDRTFNGGTYDAFVAKLRPRSMFDPRLVLDYSTYLGGADTDTGHDIGVDAYGTAFIVGATRSNDFPLVRAFDTDHGNYYDGYVSKLTVDGRGLLFSTFLGGWHQDIANAATLARDGTLYVTGETYSDDFPTSFGSYDRTFNGYRDAFVTRLSPGSFFGPAYTITFSTFLGGREQEEGHDIAVTSAGIVFVTGTTKSADFPIFDAYDGSFNGDYDWFVTKLSANGAVLNYSTFLGGSNSDQARAIALDSSGAAYVAGNTESEDFPAVGGVDSTHNGESDGFIAKLQ